MSHQNYIYGYHSVYECLRASCRNIKHIFIADWRVEDLKIRQLCKMAASQGVQIGLKKNDWFAKKLPVETHQGVVADVASYPYVPLSKVLEQDASDRQVIVIADSITDPHNLGALIRTAYQLGVGAFIIPVNRCADINATAVKSSAGATEYLSIARETNLVQSIKQLKNGGYWIYGLSGSADQLLYGIDFKAQHTAIVIGSEGKGIRPLILKHCDAHVSIPMKGQLDSLNASVAGAIVISEIMRQIGC